jgi:uncharacterized protein (TIGR00255 family)
MIRSMTGFGVATGQVGARRVAVDVRSVNHRFLTSTIRLAGELSRFEFEVRELLKRRVTRGHVTLSARFDDAIADRPALDEHRVAAWVGLLRELKTRHLLAGDVDVATVLRLPDVFTREDAPGEEDGKALLLVVDQAVEALANSREVEGATLATYLQDRLARVQAALDRVEQRAPERVIAHRERIRLAVQELLGTFAMDPQRLATEVALLAERIDVGEEVARFTAHIAAFRQTLTGAPDGVGKRLGFLLQEMLREANTTGSKANDVAITNDVVLIKEELERMREQVENIE